MRSVVVLFGWPKEPSVEATRGPRGLSVCIFVDDGFGARKRHWVSIPFVRPFKGFVCGAVGVYAQLAEEIDGVLDLRSKFIPQLDGKIAIGRAKRTDELIFECLHCPLSGVDTMIMGLNELEADLLWGEVGLDHFCSLIVHHVQFWLVTTIFKVFKILLVCFQDAARVKTRDRSGKNGVCFIMIHYKQTDVAIKCHEGELAGAVIVYDARNFIGKCSKAEDVGD